MVAVVHTSALRQETRQCMLEYRNILIGPQIVHSGGGTLAALAPNGEGRAETIDPHPPSTTSSNIKRAKALTSDFSSVVATSLSLVIKQMDQPKDSYLLPRDESEHNR